MGTTYQLPNMASYENHGMSHHAAYASTAPTSDRARHALNERLPPNVQIFNGAARCPTQVSNTHQPITLPQPQSRSSISAASSASLRPSPQLSSQSLQQQQQPVSRAPTQPSTPSSGGTMANQELSTRDTGMVRHSLQIPPCINPKGGSLVDFAAELTSLFWFESIQVLETAEKIRSIPPGAPLKRISESARPSSLFRKWVHTVLSTTQVTQNVILLALMFVYRLKVLNPGVKGRAGSEHRLFTVALMLANKFLDDNTYTNKTWAEVSGIPVTEIHVMEVEFLSNMRYSLLVSKDQWEEWLTKLARFSEYLERATRSASPSPLLIPSPSHHAFASPLPSPTGALQLTPQAFSTYSPIGSSGPNSQGWPSYSAISPLALKPEPGVLLHRKRSFPEDDPTEPPAKRLSRLPPQHQPMPQQMPQQMHQQMPQQMPQHAPQPMSQHHQQYQQPPQRTLQLPSQAPIQHQQAVQQSRMSTHHAIGLQATQQPMASSGSQEQSRLSVPNLTLNTNHGPVQTPSFPAVTYAPPQASPLSLPPMVSGVRAMSTVFPPAGTYASQHSVLASSGPSLPSNSGASVTPTTSFPPPTYGTPTKRLSPQNSLTPVAGYAGSSPLVDSFHHHLAGTPIGNHGSASGAHTPIANSPSIYLQHRNSPYKPVRHVNTLLYPPPSAFLQQYHFTNSVPPNQMHYQPLGRRNELRTGIVPEFTLARAQQGAMAGGQHHAVTPGGYPVPQVLPNPNQGRPQYAPPPLGRPVPLNHTYN